MELYMCMVECLYVYCFEYQPSKSEKERLQNKSEVLTFHIKYLMVLYIQSSL